MNPHLTRVKQVARHRAAAQEVVDEATREMVFEIRAAHNAGVPKVDIARAAGVSRPTVDKWLEEK